MTTDNLNELDYVFSAGQILAASTMTDIVATINAIIAYLKELDGTNVVNRLYNLEQTINQLNQTVDQLGQAVNQLKQNNNSGGNGGSGDNNGSGEGGESGNGDSDSGFSTQDFNSWPEFTNDPDIWLWSFIDDRFPSEYPSTVYIQTLKYTDTKIEGHVPSFMDGEWTIIDSEKIDNFDPQTVSVYLPKTDQTEYYTIAIYSAIGKNGVGLDKIWWTYNNNIGNINRGTVVREAKS